MTFISAIILLFIIMDPFGNMVVFNNLLKKIPVKRRVIVLVRESCIAYLIMLFFLFFGSNVLHYLNISAPALSIGGGVILFLVALGIVFPNRSQAQQDDEEEPFIVPIAIPLLAGPSLIAALLLLVSQHPERLNDWFLAVTIAATVTTIILGASPFILKILKRKGTRAIERLMGLLLIIISIQMLLNGIKDYLHTI